MTGNWRSYWVGEGHIAWVEMQLILILTLWHGGGKGLGGLGGNEYLNCHLFHTAYMCT